MGMGFNVEQAIQKTTELLNSGTTLPNKLVVSESLYKVVSRDVTEKYGGPSESTEYWMSRSQLEASQKNPRDLANQMGLPQQSQSYLYDVFEMKPKAGYATVFENLVAATRQGSLIREGDGMQMLVPNRKQFDAPKKVGEIEVK